MQLFYSRIEARPPPALQDSQQMIQVVLGEYVFDTLNYALFQNGFYNKVVPIELVRNEKLYVQL